MNYKEEYDRLIKFYQENPISKKDCYCERHHIMPVSCGGTDNQNNLVNLPPEIHYKVHCYLPFIFLEEGKEVEYHKMMCAWKRLLNSSDERKILYNIDENAMEYKKLRKEFAKSVGELTKITQKGSRNSRYGTHWYKDPNDKTKSKAIREGDPIPEGWVRGRWCLLSESVLTKIKERAKDRIGFYHWYWNPGTNEYRQLDSRNEIPKGFIKKGMPMKESSKQKQLEINKRKRELNKEKYYPILKPMFDLYYSKGFKAVVEKFNYNKSKENLVQFFKKYMSKEYAEMQKRKHK